MKHVAAKIQHSEEYEQQNIVVLCVSVYVHIREYVLLCKHCNCIENFRESVCTFLWKKKKIVGRCLLSSKNLSAHSHKIIKRILRFSLIVWFITTFVSNRLPASAFALTFATITSQMYRNIINSYGHLNKYLKKNITGKPKPAVSIRFTKWCDTNIRVRNISMCTSTPFIPHCAELFSNVSLMNNNR